MCNHAPGAGFYECGYGHILGHNSSPVAACPTSEARSTAWQSRLSDHPWTGSANLVLTRLNFSQASRPSPCALSTLIAVEIASPLQGDSVSTVK